MKEKYQIFISSTYTDLVEERKKVRDMILSMQHFPVGMEIFGAADEGQWDIIKDTIDSSDYYVLLVAHRYGSIIKNGSDAGISYTEKEYRYAEEQGIPILSFFIDDNVPVLPEKMERDNPEKLEAFKQEIIEKRLIKKWKNLDDLAQKVSNSLHDQIDRKKRPGWVRAELFNIEQSHAELLALNQKIRELDAENKKLKAELEVYYRLKIDRAPKLEVTMNVDTYYDEFWAESHPEYAIQDENAFLRGIKICNVSVDDADSHYKKISKDDFPSELYGFERQSEIDAYNASLPNKEELEKYKEDLKKYRQSIEGCVRINIDVHNAGTAKANNVFVEVEFPDGVMVYDDRLRDLGEPQILKVEENPIRLARDRYEEQQLWSMNLGRTAYIEVSDMELADEIENRIIDIRCDMILHREAYSAGGTYIVGKTPGNYQIKCTLMCAEYIEPQVEYGQTKLEGEQAVSGSLDKYFIVRIAWVFGVNGKNFIKTMLNVGKTHDTVRVVSDQIGTPTYTYDLARLLVDMIETDKYGYYHATNEGGYISWYDFTCEIFKQAGYTTNVVPVTTEEYGLSKAARPFNSRLDKTKLVEAGFTPLPTWQDALSRYLKEIEY